MDDQKRLTRTQSSLLRSSPTVRSLIHSLSSIAEEDMIKTPKEVKREDEVQEELLRDEKRKPHRSGSTPRQTKPNRFGSISITIFVSIFTPFLLYLRREEIITSDFFLLALILALITVFVVRKYKGIQNLAFFRQRFSLYNKPDRVEWFIGDSNDSNVKEPKPRKEIGEIREGVGFYSNGDIYEGEFSDGKCNGSGVYYFFENGRYEGDWVNGRFDGYGIESWCEGSKFRGQYREGLRNGYGVYRIYTGDCYSGEWFSGHSHGVGVQSCIDGSCFVGEFKFGVKHGLGVYCFRNGDRYAGEYFGDKMHGFGVYQFANGHCYEGSWHEGRKQGYGMYTFRNGETKCGQWGGTTLKSPLPLLTDAVLRAVQAARRTARNATQLRRVDKEVSKAVQAANRAATAARVVAVKAVQNRIDVQFCDSTVYEV